MPLSHLIALIINIHPYELNGLSRSFRTRKTNIDTEKTRFLWNVPSFGSVRPRHHDNEINSLSRIVHFRLVNVEGLGKSPNIYDVNRSGCMTMPYSKLCFFLNT